MTPRLMAPCLVCIALSGCDLSQSVAPIVGTTMGTHYGVQFGAAIGAEQRARLAAGIEQDLQRIDALMSNWREDSELSRFNAYDGDDYYPVAPETAQVVATALGISRLSDGAFDITAAPLVDLWGFGARLPEVARPATDAIAQTMSRVGWRKLQVRMEPPALRKSDPALAIDLSAIAKGYAVDVLVARLQREGLRDFLVDIGGELCARGLNAARAPWTVAIEHPSAVGAPPVLLRPGHRCVATSGDYRNYFEMDGRRYSHAIDPRTGWPVAHGLSSVTVVADDAMTADAYATALLVLGGETARMTARRYGTAAWFMRVLADGSIAGDGTPAFERFRYEP